MFDEREASDPDAWQVLQILEAGGYEAPSGTWVSIRNQQASAEAGTKLYTPERLITESLARRNIRSSYGLRRPDVADARWRQMDGR